MNSFRHSFKYITTNKKFLILLGALLLRILLAYTYRGFEADTSCFYSWASMLWENGFASFYSPDYFCDYPPGYLYVLWILGGLMKLFGMDSLSGPALLLLKTPAIVCDLISGILIYHYACKKLSEKNALLLCSVYLLHPAVWINSALWGQIDAVFTLVLISVCILFTKGKQIPAYFLFALGILIKPQILFFSPLIICGFMEYLLTEHSLKKVFQQVTGGLLSIFTALLLCLPFGLSNVISQYIDTLASYPYAAVNACNLWGLFGQNWVSQETTLGLFTYAQLGTIAIIVMTICAFVLFFKRRNCPNRYFITGAFLSLSMFLFSVRMHERYLFPVMLLLLFSYIYSPKKGGLLHFGTLSFCHLCNVFYVLYYYDPSGYDSRSLPILMISLLTVISGILFYGWLIKDHVKNPEKPTLQHSRPKLGIKPADLGIMGGICLFYAIFAFTNLGITKVPLTECPFPYNTYLELESRKEQEISHLYWYLRNEENITCRLEIQRTPESEWEYVQDFTMKNVFCWESLSLSHPASRIRITNLTKDTNIGELVLTDKAGNSLEILQAEMYSPLFDEEDTFPGTLNAMTGSYFDEIYYNKTAYEYMQGLPTYENTHPPLGKILIMLGAVLFGTSPFGFRFMGTLFGVLMLPFLYLLGRNITKSRLLGGLSTFLFAFDFMHFTQTRLATIDVFLVFFVIVMYYFMEQYRSMSFYHTPLTKTLLPLGACGISFGLGLAVKWTGAYAGAGLGILFFLHLGQRYREYRYALKFPEQNSHILAHFKEYTLKTIGFCMIFFVVIPGLIYLLSYIPFVDPANPGLLEGMFANQINMFRYHSELTADHPYASLWYEWPAMIRPIFYYSRQLEEDLRLGISAFGNPLVWWAGIPAFLYTAYLAIVSKKKTAAFLVIGYLSQYLPWILVERCTFIYHYFPSVPFLVWMIGYCFLHLKRHVTNRTFCLCITAYMIATFTLFILFYPVLSGIPVSAEYVDTYLRWLEQWVLVLH